MWIIMVVQLFVIILFSFLGWAIIVKKKYGLLSGFQGRSKDDQRRLIENGYPQKSGFLLILTALGMLILFPLVFTPFPYTIEVQFGFMLLFLMGGFIYLSKYEVPEKKKEKLLVHFTPDICCNRFYKCYYVSRVSTKRTHCKRSYN